MKKLIGLEGSIVLKKLESRVLTQKALNQFNIARAKKNKDYDRESLQRQIERIQLATSRLNRRTVSGLTYKIRDNYFSNARGTCGFSPETFEGHSYSWYSLTRVLKGVVYLNDYRYSNQTSKHIGQVSQVMRDLGIKYKTLQAPRGLQNLDSALSHSIYEIAELTIRAKYARKKNTWVKRLIKGHEKQLEVLATLGYKTTKKMRTEALARAEESRKYKNERLREKRIQKKKLESLKIVIDFEGTMHDAAGYHWICSRAWSWNESGEFVGRVDEYEKRRAVDKGFDTLIVHATEPKPFKVCKEIDSMLDFSDAVIAPGWSRNLKLVQS